ncbi:autotransporter outer membrane beta-barrel domain-containing protein [Phascolarctobacterium succinatutens]|uniref:autotransporter outer membrane beta-barrel domain-containing protein n=1 Tax=Phascolarctobacterium succinatutens TaxID=626940 RepID=UPI0026F02F30|nr:autotransporter outer membrane beta-barrel domain-containing protein [Phascolarctobacterium succinatutens]
MKQNYKIFTAALLASMSLAAAAQADDFADAQLLQTSQLVQAQRSTAMQRYAGGRLQAIWNPQVKHSDVDWWLRSFSEWESYGDDAVSGKSRSVAVGMDMNTGKETRTGIYGMYNHTELNGGGAEALQQDWRIGAYMGKQHGAVQQYGYVNYGKLGNHYNGLVNGQSIDDKYRGQIVELGGEYKYDLHHDDGKTYHVSPYVNVQASRYMQKSYRQAIPGYPDLVHASINNNYLAGETGVELRRELQNGNYAVRLGYKRVLAGEGPELAHYIEMGGNRVPTMVYSNDIDKDYLHLTLGGTLKLTKNLSATAEGAWLEGEHDRELMADVKLNWAF